MASKYSFWPDRHKFVWEGVEIFLLVCLPSVQKYQPDEQKIHMHRNCRLGKRKEQLSKNKIFQHGNLLLYLYIILYVDSRKFVKK